MNSCKQDGRAKINNRLASTPVRQCVQGDAVRLRARRASRTAVVYVDRDEARVIKETSKTTKCLATRGR